MLFDDGIFQDLLESQDNKVGVDSFFDCLNKDFSNHQKFNNVDAEFSSFHDNIDENDFFMIIIRTSN
jgi:hypothetical protein